jgi:hypothetical protein
MTDAHFWACIALLALGGWASTLVFLGKSMLPMANALGALNKVDALFDERVMKVLDRVRDRQNPARKANRDQPPQQQTPTNPLSQIFGGDPLIPVGDQPDAEGLEVVG